MTRNSTSCSDSEADRARVRNRSCHPSASAASARSSSAQRPCDDASGGGGVSASSASTDLVAQIKPSERVVWRWIVAASMRHQRADSLLHEHGPAKQVTHAVERPVHVLRPIACADACGCVSDPSWPRGWRLSSAASPARRIAENVTSPRLARNRAGQAFCDQHGRLFHRRARGERPSSVGRCGDDDVQRRLQLAAQRGPDIGERPILWRRQRDTDRHRKTEGRKRSGQHIGRQRLVTQETAQQRAEQSMLVLGPLGPRRDEIGQLEVARRQMAGPDPVAVVFVEPTPFATAQVFPDVIQVDVDRRGVASAGPLLGGRVEFDLDLGRINGFAFDQCSQRVIDLRYHLFIVP